MDPDIKKLLQQVKSNSQKLDRELAEMQAERKKREELKKLAPEVYLKARQLRDAGKFKRRVVKRTPKDMQWDVIELDCGHKTEHIESLMICKLDHDSENCEQCIENWLRRNGKKKVKAKKAQ